MARSEPSPRNRVEIEPAIVSAAIDGEAWAFREIVRFYQRIVHSVVWRMLGSPGRRTYAEDVTQEVFLRAFRSLPRFEIRGDKPMSAWLLTIAVRTAIDELRRRRPVVTALDVVAPPGTEDARPDQAAEWASTARAVKKAADALAPEIRAAFVLRAYHEMSYPEIAEALGVEVGTVKSRLHRARKALAQQLGEVGHE